MAIAEYNHNDFTNTAEADKALLVRFFYQSVADQEATEKEGRPIFTEKEFIEVRVAGSRAPQVIRQARVADKQRFPAHYEAFKKRVEAPDEGTPLAEWPQISRSQVEELSFLGVKTLEHLTAVDDNKIGSMQGGYALREAAKTWLIKAAGDSEDAEKQHLKDQVAELKAQVEALLSRDKEVKAETPASPSRPQRPSRKKQDD